MTMLVISVVKLFLMRWIYYLDTDLKGKIDLLYSAIEESNQKTIGRTLVTLDGQTCRLRECNLGNYNSNTLCCCCCCVVVVVVLLLCCFCCCSSSSPFSSSSLIIPSSSILKGNAIADGLVYQNLKDADDINGTRVYISLVNAGSIRASIDRGKSFNRWLKFYRLQNLIIKNDNPLSNYGIF